MTRETATTRAEAATAKRNRFIPPPNSHDVNARGLGFRDGPSRIGPLGPGPLSHPLSPGRFRNAKNVSAGVLLDGHPVVHLINAHYLCIAAVGSELVILAHDEGVNRLGAAHPRAQTAE